MKAKKAESRKGGAVAASPAKGRAPAAGPNRMPYAAAALAAVIAVFIAYGPSLHGAFQFDDTTLPFSTAVGAPFLEWVRSLRPVLMASYWMNARLSGDDPYSYHLVNLIIHVISGGLIFLIARRLLEWSGMQQSRRDLLAGFAALLFLLHPVQTEAVAYIAGRSECLAAMFVFAAFAVFLYRPQPAASWGIVAGVLVLFGAAILSKEHTVALVGLLLLTDFWWNPGFTFQGIRNNWKLYVPVALGAAGGVFYFRDLITHATTAGFGMKDFTWYQYFFTQCRALFVYIFQFVLPVNLTADWSFPISKTIFDRGAIVGLVALLALVGLAWRYRHRFPLAAYGFFVYLVLMAPTSSILPIKDPVAERRLYFSMLGLLLIAIDFLNRARLDRKQLTVACSVVVLAAAVATYVRAGVWADPVALWTDTVAKSPDNRRAHFQLAYALWTSGRPDQAVPEFQRTSQLGPLSVDLLMDWGLAYDGLHQPDEALAKFRQSIATEPTAAAYVNIAKIYAERGQWPDALTSLDAAQKIDDNNIYAHSYRGKIYLKTDRVREAIPEFQRALAIDPTFEDARHDLAVAQQMLRAKP
jgi:Tfp pilus assembly protein PilF